MIYTQEQQSRFLRDEYEAEVDIFKRKLDTVATTLLLQDEEMFVGQLAGMKNGQMIMLFSNNRALPRIGDHFFCMLLAPELRAYRSWGLLSYKNLVQKKELSTDSVCIWHSKSDSDKYSLVGFRGIDMAQGGLSVAGRCRCLTKDSNTSIEKEGYIPYSLQA